MKEGDTDFSMFLDSDISFQTWTSARRLTTCAFSDDARILTECSNVSVIRGTSRTAWMTVSIYMFIRRFRRTIIMTIALIIT